MSTRVNRNYSQNKYTVEKQVKKFCGVCQKAGLSEREYTSHFTKSTPGPQGIVTCPTILNNECSFCFKKGHFKNSCPVIAERERARKACEIEENRSNSKNEQPRKTYASAPVASVQDKHGGFSALRDLDSDSGDDVAVSGKRKFSQVSKPAAEWPTLNYKSSNSKNTTDKPSFASVISAAAPKRVESQSDNSGFTVLSKPPSDTRTLKEKLRFTTNWAEDSDTDEE